MTKKLAEPDVPVEPPEPIKATRKPRVKKAAPKAAPKATDPLAGLETAAVPAEKKEEQADPLAGLEQTTPPKKEQTDDEVFEELKNVARLLAKKFEKSDPDGIQRLRAQIKKAFKVDRLSLVATREDREKLIAWMKTEVQSG